MKILLVSIASLVSFTSYGQKDEYLVKNTGDTVYGKIELHNRIFFVANNGATTVEFSAADVKNIHSPNFKGNIVLQCRLSTYIDDLTELLNESYKTSILDTVMILEEIYTTPRMNLYFSKDFLQRQYYFFKTPTDIFPIQLYINYCISGASGASLNAIVSDLSSAEHLVVQKGYVNQLMAVMGDCKKISTADWETLDYRRYSLKTLIRKFNTCK